ncbi:hypothetical protein FHX61_004158 [Cupriavidus alkaliphilus]|uniref:Uncharacterized protein n=1 Tax=Cupriavidus alkaliphilus TaxID=942866 RepID=A0A7W4VD80_9BURK|nr:hypothetical protein [Cupriavidus alkaliphilus]
MINRRHAPRAALPFLLNSECRQSYRHISPLLALSSAIIFLLNECNILKRRPVVGARQSEAAARPRVPYNGYSRKLRNGIKWSVWRPPSARSTVARSFAGDRFWRRLQASFGSQTAPSDRSGDTRQKMTNAATLPYSEFEGRLRCTCASSFCSRPIDDLRSPTRLFTALGCWAASLLRIRTAMSTVIAFCNTGKV